MFVLGDRGVGHALIFVKDGVGDRDGSVAKFFLKNIVLLGPSFHHKNTERDP